MLQRSYGRLAALRMNFKQKSFLAAAILIFAGIGLMSKPTGASPSPSLVGAWHLKSVGGKDPATISIKAWQVEFREHGNWVYSGAMTGEYEGTKLSGSGTWSLKGSELDYTAGSNKGQTTVHIDDRTLTLSPDPVLRFHGKEPVETQYARQASP